MAKIWIEPRAMTRKQIAAIPEPEDAVFVLSGPKWLVDSLRVEFVSKPKRRKRRKRRKRKP